MGYCSDQAHSSVEKAALIGLVKMRYVESDENLSMRGDRLQQAIQKDRERGLIPFWVRTHFLICDVPTNLIGWICASFGIVISLFLKV